MKENRSREVRREGKPIEAREKRKGGKRKKMKNREEKNKKNNKGVGRGN